MRRNTRDINDASPACLAHRRPEDLRRQKRAPNQIQVERGNPVRRLNPLDWSFRSHSDLRVIAPGGIDQNRWQAEILAHLLKRCLQRLPIRSVSRYKQRLSPIFAYRLGSSLTSFCISPKHRDASASRGQPLCKRATKNAGSTDYDRNILRQIKKRIHGLLSPTFPTR
jgi:hypothetical protein